MSIDAHLIHTCVIENPIGISTNAYNNTVKRYASPLEGIRCRLIEDTETVKSDETSETVVKTVYTLLVLQNADLQEKARISNVRLEDGTLLNTVFEVGHVIIRRGRSAHHKTAMLERIS